MIRTVHGVIARAATAAAVASAVAVAVAVVVAGVFGVFGGGLSAQAADPVVAFSDPALKSCVLATVGSSAADVTLSQVQSLTSLSCAQRGIRSLGGLAQATSLGSLDLNRNDLADLGPISGLVQLEQLDVSYNLLQSAAAFRSLVKLQKLDASFNSIGMLGDLSGLNHLDSLNLSHNSLTSAAAFAGGARLRNVDLSFNLLSDVSFASRLTQVELLGLGSNRITSAVSFGLLQAEVDLRNQTVQLPSVAVDSATAIPVVRGASLEAVTVKLAADSQAYGYTTADGFTWRSDGIGGLVWNLVDTRPSGNTITFSGRFVQEVTRGTLVAPVPTITGSAVRLQNLTAVAGTWGPSPVALSYQWRRNDVDIAGATSKIYKLGTSDIGAKVSVAVSGTKGSYTTATTVSAPTAVVLATSLTSTPVPTIAGSAKVGSQLTATAGVWAPATVDLAYQWMRGATPIPGATQATYTLVNADAGAKIAVTVTGTKAAYVPVSKTSASTAVVTGSVIEGPVPVISGSVGVGRPLGVTTGSWVPVPVALAYQWRRGGVAIAGATSATYVPTAGDAGTQVTVTVTGSKAGFAAVSQTSASVTVPSPK